MFDGFIKTAAVTPKIKVADCIHNAAAICNGIDEAVAAGAKLIVFPELCMTGYTCEDLFWQETLLDGARQGLHQVIFHSRGKDALIFVGLPWERMGSCIMRLRPCAAGVCWGLSLSPAFQIIMNFMRRGTLSRDVGRWNGWTTKGARCRLA